jgi:hypothetical protein
MIETPRLASLLSPFIEFGHKLFDGRSFFLCLREMPRALF